MDSIVDRYFPVIDAFEEEIETLEEAIFGEPGRPRRSPSASTSSSATLIAIKRAVSPLIDVCNRLVRYDQGLIADEVRPYFRDVYDHVVRINESIDNVRELLTLGAGGEPGPRVDPAERGHEVARRLGRDLRRRDVHGRHLGHELRGHAGAAAAAGVIPWPSSRWPRLWRSSIGVCAVPAGYRECARYPTGVVGPTPGYGVLARRCGHARPTGHFRCDFSGISTAFCLRCGTVSAYCPATVTVDRRRTTAMIRGTTLALAAALAGSLLLSGVAQAASPLTLKCVRREAGALKLCINDCRNSFKSARAACYGPGLECANACTAANDACLRCRSRRTSPTCNRTAPRGSGTPSTHAGARSRKGSSTRPSSSTAPTTRG